MVDKGQAATAIKKICAKAKEWFDNRHSLSNMQWLLIVGAYIMLFWDFMFGLFMTIAIIIYMVAMKSNPSKVESFLRSCKERLQPIISQPMLYRSLLVLIAGLLIYRVFSHFLGIIVIILSSVLLVCFRWAPTMCEKIMVFFNNIILKVKPLWDDKWVKVACGIFLIILPLSTHNIDESDSDAQSIENHEQEYDLTNHNHQTPKVEPELSEREILRQLNRQLKKEYEEALIKLNNTSDYQEYRELSETIRRLERESKILEQKAQSMGIPHLGLL